MTRILGWLLAIVVLLFGVSFSFLNNTDVTVNYYLATSSLPLPLLLLIALLLGMVLSVLMMSFKYLKQANEVRRLSKRLKSAEEEVANIRNMPIKDQL